jgi:uncharacterized protein YkwD
LLLVLLILILINSPLSAAAAGLTDTTPEYFYTIQPGDTLWHIAIAHGISVERLAALNATLGDPKFLRPGQKLRVPGPAVMPAPAPEAPPAAAPDPGAAPEGDPPVIEPQVETPPPAPQPESHPAINLPPEIAGWPALLLEMINEKRRANNLPELTWSPELIASAQAHADDCAARNRGSHVGSDGSRLRERLARAGYQASWASENWVYAQSVENAFRFWWNEPPGADPHRRNILHTRYTEIGIGIAKGSWGYYFIANFGSP